MACGQKTLENEDHRSLSPCKEDIKMQPSRSSLISFWFCRVWIAWPWVPDVELVRVWEAVRWTWMDLYSLFLPFVWCFPASGYFPSQRADPDTLPSLCFSQVPCELDDGGTAPSDISEGSLPSCLCHVLDISKKAWESHANFSAFRRVLSILRSLAAETDFEILQCRCKMARGSVASTFLPITVISCHVVSPLNVLATAASNTEGLQDFQVRALSGLISRMPFVAVPCCHAIVCTLLLEYLASVGILHKDNAMTNLDRNVHRLAVIGCQCGVGKVVVFSNLKLAIKWEGTDSSQYPHWHLLRFMLYASFWSQILRLSLDSEAGRHLTPIPIPSINKFW